MRQIRNAWILGRSISIGAGIRHARFCLKLYVSAKLDELSALALLLAGKLKRSV